VPQPILSPWRLARRSRPTRARDPVHFYGRFYGWPIFSRKTAQNADTRHQTLPIIGTSEKHAAQHHENVRKNSLGNYKSAARFACIFHGALPNYRASVRTKDLNI